jgi:hypothetical protein
LEERLKEFEDNVEGTIKSFKDNYLYYIDPRYEEIRKKFI